MNGLSMGELTGFLCSPDELNLNLLHPFALFLHKKNSAMASSFFSQGLYTGGNHELPIGLTRARKENEEERR